MEPSNGVALTVLFPDEVAVATLGDDAVPPPLLPEEAVAVARAVPKRRDEFARGRACARAALGQLGLSHCPIPMGTDRAPVWPSGIVGSITHCRGLVAAVAARSGAIAALGLDAEPWEPLSSELTTLICTPYEIDSADHLPRYDSGHWQRLILSAKETVHKCVAPLTGEMLDFLDVRIVLDPGALAFHVGAESPRARSLDILGQIRGRFLVTPSHLVTAGIVNAVR